jgi:sugar/nucleoside kinase (ribokinase family)
MLTTELVERVLGRVGSLKVAVVGDLFLDRYLDLDGTLTEPSLETGLEAYQVVNVRSMPGAAGTVINNLVALGVGAVAPASVIGLDGEGYELEQALRSLPGVDLGGVIRTAARRTPTYTKPMLSLPGRPARELNRLDVHPRAPLPADVEARLDVAEYVSDCDAVAVLDQVTSPECGVVTSGVRRALQGLRVPVLADSRFRIGEFRGVMLKPNERECLAAAPSAAALAERAGRPVFCTRGERGILLAEPDGQLTEVPGYRVAGPVDPVGAGDSTTAGILCALASGLTPAQAAAFGCLVASITVQKLGTTGTATPDEVRARWRELTSRSAGP